MRNEGQTVSHGEHGDVKGQIGQFTRSHRVQAHNVFVVISDINVRLLKTDKPQL